MCIYNIYIHIHVCVRVCVCVCVCVALFVDTFCDVSNVPSNGPWGPSGNPPGASKIARIRPENLFGVQKAPVRPQEGEPEGAFQTLHPTAPPRFPAEALGSPPKGPRKAPSESPKGRQNAPRDPPKSARGIRNTPPKKQKPKLLQRASMTTHEAFRGRNSEYRASMNTIREKSLRNINNDDESTTKSLREYGPPPLSDHIWADLAFIRPRKQNNRERGRSGA